MEGKISARYAVKALCEISVDINGSNYLVIYGTHVNGYWCCIPNWQIGCEMAEPSDTSYNKERLIGTGSISKAAAKAIAQAIALEVQD